MDTVLEKPHVSEKLKEELTKRKWSYTTLAAESGISEHRINKIMAGGARITKRTSELLGKALGKNPEYFLQLQDSWEWMVRHG